MPGVAILYQHQANALKRHLTSFYLPARRIPVGWRDTFNGMEQGWQRLIGRVQVHDLHIDSQCRNRLFRRAERAGIVAFALAWP